MRILSTLDDWSTIPGWGDRLDSVSLACEERPGWFGSLVAVATEIINGVMLWWLSRSYEAVTTDCRPHVAVFGLLERLTFWSKRRHLMFECYWVNPSGPVQKRLRALQFRAAGGDAQRDYKTLCEAVMGLEVRVVIAARDRSPFGQFQVPANGGARRQT